MNKEDLILKIMEMADLSNDEKAEIVGSLRRQKKYGLVWEDHPEDAEERLKSAFPVLREDKEAAIISDAADAPDHVLIEGDNLEALMALSYTHEGKVDVIYIDPPYNTGNKDFVYNDSFVGSEDGYRHSKWLSFMEKRLRLAKKLLSDKGVIFISIDDNEQANLKLLCDEVFSGMDFLATIPWRKRTAKSDVPHGLSQDCESILCYCRERFQAGIKKDSRKYYETPDFPGRPWRVHDLTKQTSAEERPMSYFTIINPKNGEEFPANKNRTWAITKDTFDGYYAQDRIVFPGDYNFLNIARPVLRYWKEDDMKKAGDMFGFTAVSSNLPPEVGMTQDGTKDLDSVFGFKAFGFPKPLALIKYILQISKPIANDVTILDFFAGSGTTLHATMQLNAEDGGHRQCILVTNNENNICREVTYERNKRVIQGYTTPKGVAVEGLHNNNLRYYTMDFLPREHTNEAKRELMRAATDMLCIKEGIYNEVREFCGMKFKPSILRYFKESDGRQMLLIFDERAVEHIVPLLLQQTEDEGKLKVYVFSNGAYAYEDEFLELRDKVELCALPEAILQVYNKVLPQKEEEVRI